MSKPDDIEYFLVAPSKINLSLNVGSDVSRGKHSVMTVMQSTSLCDYLHAKIIWDDQNPGVSINMISTHGIDDCDVALEDNLVYKAIMAYLEQIGETLTDRIEITIEKNVPPRSGLGGGSSDCAATIAFMATLYGRDPKGEDSIAVAKKLGSDVAFFLMGGCVLLNGFGDEYVKTMPSPALDLVITRPLKGLSTCSVYNLFDDLVESLPADELHVREAEMAQRRDKLIDTLEANGSAREIASLIDNNMQEAACKLEPEVCDVIEELQARGGTLNAMLSGSGSSVFAICDSEEAANDISASMRERGWWSVTCKSVSFGAGVGDSL